MQTYGDIGGSISRNSTEDPWTGVTDSSMVGSVKLRYLLHPFASVLVLACLENDLMTYEKTG